MPRNEAGRQTDVSADAMYTKCKMYPVSGPKPYVLPAMAAAAIFPVAALKQA
jgi:hypothetical protein